MKKYDYIENIMLSISGATGINFQNKVKEVLAVYYREKDKTYEMPDYYGGDQKNDGWVVEDALFYQIYAPTRLKLSLRNEIQVKFKGDLEGLLKLIVDEKKWNATIKEFVFIVNTFDNNLPHDSSRFFYFEVGKLSKKYGVQFAYRVVNQDYIKDILYSISDVEILSEIASRLQILNTLNAKGITESMIIDLIINISTENMSKTLNVNAGSSYERISTVRKIEKNGLLPIKDEIEGIMINLDVVEKAIATMNQDIIDGEHFQRVKSYIIDVYDELSMGMQGVQLYNQIIERCLQSSASRWDFTVPMKYLVVYIFDKCDIFEKE